MQGKGLLPLLVTLILLASHPSLAGGRGGSQRSRSRSYSSRSSRIHSSHSRISTPRTRTYNSMHRSYPTRMGTQSYSAGVKSHNSSGIVGGRSHTRRDKMLIGSHTRTLPRSSRTHSAVTSRHIYKRIKRSSTAKEEFMRRTGYPHGRPGYVVDHVVPLACGGADTPSNMQWQTVAQAKTKDKVERRGCK